RDTRCKDHSGRPPTGLTNYRRRSSHSASSPPWSVGRYQARRTTYPGRSPLRHDPERAAHEGVDAAEEDVRSRTQVRGRRPLEGAGRRWSVVTELTGVELERGVRDGIGDAGAQVARQLARRDRVPGPEAARRRVAVDEGDGVPGLHGGDGGGAVEVARV